jgi:hypothetical protein
MHSKLLLAGILLGLYSIPSYSLVLNTALAQYAEIDIIVSQQEQATPFLSGPIVTDNSHTIARYSFYLKSNNDIALWQKIYAPNTLNFFIKPESRVSMATLMENPFSLILSEQDLRFITGLTLTQVYVVVRQRLFFYDPSRPGLVLCDYAYLHKGFVPANAVVDTAASGTIAPGFMGTVPSGQDYQEAQGVTIIN